MKCSCFQSFCIHIKLSSPKTLLRFTPPPTDLLGLHVCDCPLHQGRDLNEERLHFGGRWWPSTTKKRKRSTAGISQPEHLLFPLKDGGLQQSGSLRKSKNCLFYTHPSSEPRANGCSLRQTRQCLVIFLFLLVILKDISIQIWSGSLFCSTLLFKTDVSSTLSVLKQKHLAVANTVYRL